MHIAVLVACHNRMAVTVRGISSLVEALGELSDAKYELFIVDDGSTDGTSAALVDAFPQAHVERGNGQLFWNGGMCRAYQLARERGSFSDYLLFNDDVVVSRGALIAFIEEYVSLNASFPAILAAATLGTDSNVSYSAYLRPCRSRPLNLKVMNVTEHPQPCHTFNGNFVLVPSSFFDRIGGLDRTYVHAYGDLDLGYTAMKMGIQPHLSSVLIGACPKNIAPQGNSVWKILRGTWGKADSLGQRLYFIRKHSPLVAQMVTIPLTMFRYGVDRAARYVQKLRPGASC